MEALLWGIAVVAAACLLQVPVTAWLGRYFDQDRPVPEDPSADLPVTADAYDRHPGTCPSCGRHNDASFDYCANCLAPIYRLRR